MGAVERLRSCAEGCLSKHATDLHYSVNPCLYKQCWVSMPAASPVLCCAYPHCTWALLLLQSLMLLCMLSLLYLCCLGAVDPGRRLC